MKFILTSVLSVSDIMSSLSASCSVRLTVFPMIQTMWKQKMS